MLLTNHACCEALMACARGMSKSEKWFLLFSYLLHDHLLYEMVTNELTSQSDPIMVRNRSLVKLVFHHVLVCVHTQLQYLNTKLVSTLCIDNDKIQISVYIAGFVFVSLVYSHYDIIAS